MFDKFGEFDSAGELNKAAAGQLEENDIKSLMELAAENGIDEADVQDYINGDTDELCSDIMAAYGKLEVEKKDIKGKYGMAKRVALREIFNMACSMLCNDEMFAGAVRKKKKRIEQIYALMENAAKKHREGSVGVVPTTDKTLENIIRKYYLEGDEKAAEYIESLYEEG